jgi:hypothetical protein
MRSEAHGDCSAGGRDADAHGPTRDIIHVLDLPDLRVTCTKAFRLCRWTPPYQCGKPAVQRCVDEIFERRWAIGAQDTLQQWEHDLDVHIKDSSR